MKKQWKNIINTFLDNYLHEKCMNRYGIVEFEISIQCDDLLWILKTSHDDNNSITTNKPSHGVANYNAYSAKYLHTKFRKMMNKKLGNSSI